MRAHTQNYHTRVLTCCRMDKVESDFETLKDYNDYLETVEEVTWNLILKTDVEATERKLRLWEEAQKAELNPNASRRAFDPDPSLPSDTAQVVLKKGGTQRKMPATGAGTQDPLEGADDAVRDTGFVFRGLKKRKAPEPVKDFDPFDGWSFEPQYYVVQDNYHVDWLTKTKDDPGHIAGGYDMRDFYGRALCDAFAGFGVFIQDEIVARENQVSGDADIGTDNAAVAAAGGKDVNMDDVF